MLILVIRVSPSLELLDIIGFIKEVDKKWSSVAAVLGLRRDVVSEIEHACDSDMECCRMMLSKWPQTADPLHSWELLIEACNRNFLHSLAVKLQLFFASK